MHSITCNHIYYNTLTLTTTISGLYYFNSLQIGLPVSALVPPSLSPLIATYCKFFIQHEIKKKTGYHVTTPLKSMHAVTPYSLSKSQSPYNGVSGFTRLTLFHVSDVISCSAVDTAASLLFLELTKHTLVSDPGTWCSFYSENSSKITAWPSSSPSVLAQVSVRLFLTTLFIFFYHFTI